MAWFGEAGLRWMLRLVAAPVQDQQQQSSKASPRQRELVSLCQLPFVLTPEAKARIMQGEALMQKQHQAQAWTIQVIMITQQALQTTQCLRLSKGFVVLHLVHMWCGKYGCRAYCHGATLSVQQHGAQDGAVQCSLASS